MTYLSPVEGFSYPLRESRPAGEQNVMAAAVIGRAWRCQKVEASA